MRGEGEGEGEGEEGEGEVPTKTALMAEARGEHVHMISHVEHMWMCICGACICGACTKRVWRQRPDARSAHKLSLSFAGQPQLSRAGSGSASGRVRVRVRVRGGVGVGDRGGVRVRVGLEGWGWRSSYILALAREEAALEVHPGHLRMRMCMHMHACTWEEAAFELDPERLQICIPS